MTGRVPAEAREKLFTSIQFVRGVGPQRAQVLEKRLGLRSVADLIFFFPRDYEELGAPRQIQDLEEGENATVACRIVEFNSRKSAAGQAIVSALVQDDTGYLRLVWFNQPYVRHQLRMGRKLLVVGTPKQAGLSWEMVHPKVRELRDDEELPEAQLLPIYRLTEGIRQSQMRRIIHVAVEQNRELLNDVLPEPFRAARDLLGIQDSVRLIHQPGSQQELQQARRRLVYQELLVLQLGLAMRRQLQTANAAAPCLDIDARLHARILSRFPFDLTPGQQTAIDEIRKDVRSARPMNRLLQGDVGSGKTAVAFYCLLASVAHGHQAVLMAPTEILAQQHIKNFERMLVGSPLKPALLTGGLSNAAHRSLLDGIRSGDVKIVFGTHALLNTEVRFHDLGLVIVDEQHKFGVRQRHHLREVGGTPHYLVMTATPIPRSVTMAMFGDLDVSTIVDRPQGRRTVHTYVGHGDQREQWWKFVRNKLREGRQAYVIAPLVDEGTDATLASVEAMFEDLANGAFADFQIGLLHGRLTAEEKRETMQRFATGETQLLVATSVVEVGVDVGNATVMTIESAERFGLAQLHQLRGRVSRGKFDGYVCVFCSENPAEQTAIELASDDPATTESSDRQQELLNQRIAAFASTNDGFELAELDFQLRGPGNLFGTQQHGLPPFRIADLRRDKELLTAAREDARRLIDEEDALQREELQPLRSMVIARYGKVLDLGDVG